MDETFVTTTTHQPEHRSLTRLAGRFSCDAAAAVIASFGISPIITVIDRAIAENASGLRTLSHAVKDLSVSMVRHPVQFCKSREFMWIFGLYSATYATANSVETLYEWKDHGEFTKDGQVAKLSATTLVNMTSVIAKDKAFAQMFGVVRPHPFPLASIGLFAVRDAITVVSCFHTPQVVAEKLKDSGMSERSINLVAQIGTPVAVQVLSTPLHLLGLDLYNHAVADRMARLQFIQREFFRSALARVARVGPAFGVGGIANSSCRTTLREMFE